MQLLDGINVERSKAGLAPYTYDAGLTTIARTRVQQMADQNYFAHTDPYGYSMYVGTARLLWLRQLRVGRRKPRHEQLRLQRSRRTRPHLT